MSRKPEVDSDNRNRSNSDNRKETANSKYPKNSFKVTGQLVLDGSLERRIA